MRDSARLNAFLWLIVLGHFLITIVHGAAHAAAAVPLTPAANLFVILVIVIGPLAGAAMSRWWPVAAGWVVAATMSGALVFGIVNHYVVAGPDQVSHVTGGSRGLFAATAALVMMSETAGIGAGIWYATRRMEGTT